MDLSRKQIQSAVVAGVLGTLGFSAFFSALGNTGVIEMAIPALYGVNGPAIGVGMAIHLFHGAVLGVVYALIMASTSYGHHLEDVKMATGWGLAYGALTTVLLAGLLMPVWLSAMNFGGAPSVPNLNVPGLVGHLIYGAVLGASYPLIYNRLK